MSYYNPISHKYLLEKDPCERGNLNLSPFFSVHNSTTDADEEDYINHIPRNQVAWGGNGNKQQQKIDKKRRRRNGNISTFKSPQSYYLSGF